jgi:lysophospholipase L1-like esterase
MPLLYVPPHRSSVEPSAGSAACSIYAPPSQPATLARRTPHPPINPTAVPPSLTEGLTDGSTRFHPYALRLRDLLRGALPAGCRLAVDQRGRSGERVVPQMQVWALVDAVRSGGGREPWLLWLRSRVIAEAQSADGLGRSALPSFRGEALLTLPRASRPHPPTARLPLPPLPTDHAATNQPRRTPQERLLSTLADAAANGEPYDFVLLLGGTNDIGTGRPAAAVLAALDAMHSAVAASGARLVAMTLPPFNMQLPAAAAAAYGELNGGLRRRFAAGAADRGGGGGKAAAEAAAAVAAATTGSGGEKAAAAAAAVAAAAAAAPAGGGTPGLLLDLEPLFPVKGPAAATTWDDRLHLRPAGYDRMGEAIFETMRPLLAAAERGHRHRREQQHAVVVAEEGGR